ncbi:MAG TPA: O-unit flippase-like protein [Verrucomicrobiota bacterium]|jgi:O-antigen/teichoic acid export membrane protein|nr:O-unit flippase-like protein [Verrucomicrobiota bacterium]
MIFRWPLPFSLIQPGALLKRLHSSTVAWFWVFNGLRLATGILLLPLVLRKLSTEELGMYYVFLSQVALAPVIDFGFSPTILRFVSYAMGGAETIQPQGVSKSTGTGPNFGLLWQLFFTTRALYRVLALVLLVILGIWGTYIVNLRVLETPCPRVTWVAWGITLIATVLNIYSSWAPVFLRGMNEVLISVRITVLASGVRFAVAAGLFLAGAGLMSLPLGDLTGSVIQQVIARGACLRRLRRAPSTKRSDVWQQLRIIWPNSWRLGLVTMGGYLTVNANTLICLKVLGLAANARYGLSIQLLGIISGMASAWTQVKWPIIGQHRARHDYAAIQQIFWPRMWLQYLTFLAMAAGLLVCGQPLLQLLGSNKQMLVLPWLALLALNSFLEMQTSIWGTLITTENRIPFLWPSLASKLLSFGLSLTFIYTTSLGLGALVLAPFLAHCLFDYWYWPIHAARGIQTSLARFMFSRPKGKPGTL